MAVADTITTQLAAIQSGEQAVLTAALTQAFNDGAASVAAGGITPAQEQLDIAAAVSSAVAPLNSQISSLQLSVSQEQALLASVQSAVAALLALINPPPPPPAS